jgi:hypothetical protein
MALSYLFNGIQYKYQRSSYQADSVRVRKNYDPKFVHSYNGKITKTAHNLESNETIYHIDDIIKITTVSDQLRINTINELEKGKSAVKKFTYVSAGASILGYGMLYINPSVCGAILLGTGIVGLSVAIYRESKLTNEIMKWRNRLPEYIATRQNIPMNIPTYKHIHHNQLIGKFLLREEAYKLWNDDIISHRATYKMSLGSDRKTRANIVRQFVKYNPLMFEYVRYFNLTDRSLDELLNNLIDPNYEIAKRIENAIDQFKKLDNNYKFQVDLIKKVRNGYIIQQSRNYELVQDGIATVQTVDNINDAVKQNKDYDNQFVKNIGYFTVSNFVEQAKIKTAQDIKREYAIKLYQLELNYDSHVSDLLCIIAEIYTEYNINYRPIKSKL